MREKHPSAEFMVHPECRPEVLALADFVGSTADILRQAERSAAQTLVIGTEVGVLHSLKRDRAERPAFILQPGLVCANMKKTRLQHVYDALQYNRHRIQVAESLREPAKHAISRMLEIAG
jgi:quinolinate synthase